MIPEINKSMIYDRQLRYILRNEYIVINRIVILIKKLHFK